MERRAAMVDRVVDERVIAACQRGDRDAFRALFDAYKDKIYSITLHFFGGDDALAGDVTQQVFLKLFDSIGQFRRDSEFATWLYRLVSNVCIDEHRRRRRFVPFAETLLSNIRVSEKLSQEEDCSRRETADYVRAAIARLTPKLRIVVLLRHFEDLSYDEMACALGCSKGTVASRLNRGHKILARHLRHLREADAAKK